MTNFEMVEMLRQKANVSYEEAKAALEQANWDLLDAMVLLEKEGKVSGDGGGSYSTRPEEEVKTETKGKRRSDGAFRWLGETFLKLVKAGNENHFVVAHREKELFTLPVTVFVLLVVIGFWFCLAALAVGLFCGLRYSFRGPNLGKQAINDAMNRAADVAENVKEEFRNATHSDEGERKQENGNGEAK